MGLPMINVRNDLKSPSLPMHLQQVFIDPHNDMVLESAFDYLMEEVRW